MGPKPKVSKGNDDEEMVISYFKKSSTKELAGQLTNSEIASKIDTLEKSNAQHETKLAAYKKKNVVASAGEKKKLEAKHDKARREWVARRKMFKEVLDTILERSSKKKKDLQEEIGWEADEDLNITIIPDRTKKDNSSTSSSSSAPEYKRHKKAYS
ncbi:homologous-pairing protein 2 [Heterostelium album PN500]|uniref:Homologous-pairing protein 2 n=1 Tax=Heterostelium pallidum (strain ATCC 26659 / Pp 5 / PN500) TaxID=670386 RepID=D3BU08_HETP5|nr:homologous-pairing protein 2 [Heterostelium album PN500]EFA75194.1 homologous-pairing protein 2 [Heterostelium album PN500]|eukprot:XP_020427328.1 homologous-pairing protein 2 [Heterostelium album PN500]